jgi:hypothetical protein
MQAIAPFITPPSNLQMHDHDLRRDDLTFPEKISCMVLFFLFLILLIFFYANIVFGKLRKKKKGEISSIYYFIISLLTIQISCRLGSLSDSLTLFFSTDEDYHFIPISLDYCISVIGFICISELCLIFSLLW